MFVWSKSVSIEQHKPCQILIHGKLFHGRLFQVQGEELELYRIGALAHALKKVPQTILKWEHEGLFPEPIFRMLSTGHGHSKRWYTRGQLINIYKVWNLFPIDRGRSGDQFFKAIKQVFYKLHEVPISLNTKQEHEYGTTQQSARNLRTNTRTVERPHSSQTPNQSTGVGGSNQSTRGSSGKVRRQVQVGSSAGTLPASGIAPHADPKRRHH